MRRQGQKSDLVGIELEAEGRAKTSVQTHTEVITPDQFETVFDSERGMRILAEALQDAVDSTLCGSLADAHTAVGLLSLRTNPRALVSAGDELGVADTLDRCEVFPGGRFGDGDLRWSPNPVPARSDSPENCVDISELELEGFVKVPPRRSPKKIGPWRAIPLPNLPPRTDVEVPNQRAIPTQQIRPRKPVHLRERKTPRTYRPRATDARLPTQKRGRAPVFLAALAGIFLGAFGGMALVARSVTPLQPAKIVPLVAAEPQPTAVPR